jgi:predicted transcriptional regulator
MAANEMPLPPFARIASLQVVLDDATTGAAAKAYRKAAGVSGRHVARQLEMCSSVLSDLENGKRRWTLERAHGYWSAVESSKGKLYR